MIVYVSKNPEFYRKTPEDKKIIQNRILKLHHMARRHQGEAYLPHKYIAVDLAWKDYSHILPWLMVFHDHGSLSIRTA